ncbi:MAG: hypothetical protein ACREBE_25180 [bacterium]
MIGMRLRGIGVLVGAGLLAAASGFAASPADDEAVAVVASLAGHVSVRTGEKAAREAALFDWLPRGAIVETASGSRVLLAFANGKRFDLGAGARATLAQDGLAVQSGPVSSLPAVPPLPRLATVAAGAVSDTTAGVVRIRGTRLSGLYPRAGTRVLHERATLRFAPVAGVERYRVDVEDEAGAPVFHAESDSGIVSIPPGMLKPSTHYYWRVRGLLAVGAAPRGEEEFETLDAGQAAGWTSLADVLRRSGDADSLALLSAVDRSLGLLFEAQADLRAALARSPEQAGLRDALAGVENEMGGR